MEKNHDRIELRSKKMQTIMREIPRGLLRWNIIVAVIITAALLAAYLELVY